MDAQASTIAAAMQELQLKNFEGYGRSTIPNERDDFLRTLVEHVQTQAHNQTGNVSNLDAIQRLILRAFAERCATLAARSFNAHDLEIGIVALALSCDGVLGPEQWLVLSLLSDASQRLGLSDRDAFVSALAPLDLEHGEFVAFADRAPEDKSIAAMGYQWMYANGVGQYVRTW